MMWILVVVAAHGSTAATQWSLSECNRNLSAIDTEGVTQAYCKNAGTDDILWFIKDGKRLIDPQAFVR